MAFIKAAGTETAVANSKRELERIMQRYEARRFGVMDNYDSGTATVTFEVPDQPGGRWIPVQLDVIPHRVAKPLYGKPWEHLTDRQREQCARVAWRQLVLLVDAACCAAAAGLRPMSHTFLAETLVVGSDGQRRHLVEELDVLAGGQGWQQRMLPPGRE